MPFLSTNKNYKRLYSAPLDTTSVFNTKAELDAYVASPTSYIGQVITCIEENKVYFIDSRSALKEIGKVTAEEVIYNGTIVYNPSSDEYSYWDSTNKRFVKVNLKVDMSQFNGMIVYDETTKKYQKFNGTDFEDFEINQTGSMKYDPASETYSYFNGTNYVDLELKGSQDNAVIYEPDTGVYYYINPEGQFVQLEIGNGTQVATITCDYEGTRQTCGSNEEFIVPIFFTTPNTGTATVHVLVNNVEIKNETVKQGYSNINLGKIDKGENSVKIYVVDRGGVYSNDIKFTLVSGALEITSTFDAEQDFNLGNVIRIDFTASQLNNNPLTLNVELDGNKTTKSISTGFNTYNLENVAIGVHKLVLYLTDTEITSNKLTYQIVVIDSENLYISSQFDETVEYAEGEKVSIDYRISYASANEFNVKYYIDGVEFRTLKGVLGINYWNISSLKEGSRVLKIEVSTKDGTQVKELTFNLTITASTFQEIEVPKVGILFDFSAEDRSNNDLDKATWTDKSGNNVVAELVGFNFNSNGWINDALVCDGETYVKINATPLADNVQYGFTLDCQFEVSDTGNEARVLDLTSPASSAQGFYIGVNDAMIKSKVNELTTGFNQDTKTRITFVIDRDMKFAKIYINAVLCEAYQLTDSGTGVSKILEDFSNTSSIYLNSKKGTSMFGNCKIYNIRAYDRALTSDEVLQVHLADIKDPDEQKAKYEFNYNNEMPTMYIYGDTTGISKDDRVKVRINYMSTDETKYGSSFDLANCELQWQGTSSLQYPVKNYRIRLYNDFGEKYMYTPFGENAIKENLFCLKADMIDSAHYRNTGNATYVNDNLYGELNPAQQANPNVRNTIDGFPIQLYINGEYIGVFNFNNDKSNKKVFGLTKSFPQCISYEVSANSNVTAGAFNKWTSATGLTEEQYYYNDFELRYSSRAEDANEDAWDITPLKRIVDWVSDADETEFKANFEQHFNKRYTIDYYIFTMTAGLIDNFGKNMMLTTWDGQIFYPQFYDLDSCLSLNNSGYRRYNPYIEVTPDVFNTSDSKLWTKLVANFWDDIKARYKELRNSVLTFDKLMEYYYGRQISKIGEKQYNEDMETKYLKHTEYLFMLHGNDLEHLKSWLSKRISFLDNFFDYAFDENNTITIRANKLGEVYLDIQVYGEQYIKVKWKNGLETRQRVSSGQTVRFTGETATSQDQEIIIYNASNLKSIGDISNLNPSQLFIGNATRLVDLTCHSDLLLNLDLSANTSLQSIDLSNCSILGKETGAVMDVSALTNLKTLNLYGTQITSVKTNEVGGNIVEIYYPTTIKSIDLRNQTNLTTAAIPQNSNLADLTLVNLNNLTRINATYTDGELTSIDSNIGKIINNLQTVNLQNCLDVLSSINIEDTSKLVSINLVGLNNLTSITLGGNSQTSDGAGLLSNISISECSKFNTLKLQSTNDLTHFVGSTTIDLGRCFGLKNFFDNIGIEGTDKILLPNTIKVIQINGNNNSSITKMWLKDNTTATEGFDQQGITLTDNTLNLTSAINLPCWKNMNYKSTDLDPGLNTRRTVENYIRPYGRIDFSTWSIAEDKVNLLITAIRGLKPEHEDYTLILPPGLDLADFALEELKSLPASTPWSEVFTKLNALENLTDATQLFKDRSFVDDSQDLILDNPTLVNCSGMFEGSNIPRITAINLETECILDRMFYGCTSLQSDCLIPITTASCIEMFKNCSNIITTSNNYERYYGHYFPTQAMYEGVGNTSYTYPNEMLDSTSNDISVSKKRYLQSKNSEVTLTGNSQSVTLKFTKAGPNNNDVGGNSFYVEYSTNSTYHKNDSGLKSKLQAYDGYYNDMTGYLSGSEYINNKSVAYSPHYSNIKLGNEEFKIGDGGIDTDTTIDIPYIYTPNIDYSTMFELLKSRRDSTKLNDFIKKTCGSGVISIWYSHSTVTKLDIYDFSNYRYATSAVSSFENNTTVTTVNMPDTYNLQNCEKMFKSCSALTTFNIPSLQKLQNGYQMFYSCRNLQFNNVITTEGFPELTNAYMMFQSCSKLTTIDLKNTSKLTNANNMFNGCSALTEVKNLSHCTSLQEMDYMFFGTPITSIDLSGLSSVNLMQYAFSTCTNLTTVTGLNGLTNCTSIYAAFKGCTSLASVNNGQEINLPKVTNANEAFNGCTALKQINLNLPAIANLSTNANSIFTGSGLTKIKLTATSASISNNLFSGLTNLQELDFNCGNNCSGYANLLKNCTGLTKLKINVTSYNSDDQDRENGNHGPSDKDYTLLGYCTGLTDIDFYGEIKYSLSFKYNPSLSSKSIDNIINALHNYGTGGSSHTFILPSSLNLTSAQIDGITSKGFTIVWD